MEIFTIGFGGKTASQFFESLKVAGVQQLVDVRLNNVSQLAGFTKRSDLPYFLNEIARIDYRHELLLAPEDEDLKAYRKKQLSWDAYAAKYAQVLQDRDVAHQLSTRDLPERIALLCSEPAAEKCHRRIAAEYFESRWPGVTVIHL